MSGLPEQISDLPEETSKSGKDNWVLHLNDMGATEGTKTLDRRMTLANFLDGILYPDENDEIDLTGISLLNIANLTVSGSATFGDYIVYNNIFTGSTTGSLLDTYTDLDIEFGTNFLGLTPTISNGITVDSNGYINFASVGWYQISLNCGIDVTKTAANNYDFENAYCNIVTNIITNRTSDNTINEYYSDNVYTDDINNAFFFQRLQIDSVDSDIFYYMQELTFTVYIDSVSTLIEELYVKVSPRASIFSTGGNVDVNYFVTNFTINKIR